MQRLRTGELVGVGLDDAGVYCVCQVRGVEGRGGTDVEGVFSGVGEQRQEVQCACEVTISVA